MEPSFFALASCQRCSSLNAVARIAQGFGGYLKQLGSVF